MDYEHGRIDKGIYAFGGKMTGRSEYKRVDIRECLSEPCSDVRIWITDDLTLRGRFGGADHDASKRFA